MHGTTYTWRRGPRLLALAAGAAAAILVLSGSAGAAGKYADKSGDNGLAPDITGATVTSDAGGLVVFRINVTNLPSSGDVEVALFIDSDANPDSGYSPWGGVDYAFFLDRSDHTYSFAHWTGFSWDFDTPYATVRVSTGSSGATISVNRTELADTSQFNFWVGSLVGVGGEGNVDLAPDDGLWNYDLQAGGPDIREVSLTTAPASGPKAGTRFTVSVASLKLPPTDGDPGIAPQPESTSCSATLKGKALTGSGPGGCSWKLQKKARGKQLKASVTVTYQGATKTFVFSFRVR